MPTSSTFSTSNTYVKYNITVNVNSQNIANNTSNITVTVRFWRSNVGYETYGTGNIYCGINGTSYSQAVSSSQRITSSGIDLFSRTVDIGHNADGSKTIWCSAYISLNTPLSSSDQGFNVTLPTIPRASSVSGGSGNIGGTSTINISRASSSFTHILYYSFGSISWRWIASNVGTSHSWTLPNDLYAQIPNANRGTGTMICETYSGSTYIGTSYANFTASVVNSNPVFTASQLTYKDSNSNIVDITKKDQLIVRNQSNLQITFSAATAQNNSTISKYQTIFNGVTTDRNSAGTYSLGAVNSASNLTLQVRAIDSRNNSTTISKTVTILDWVAPIINANAARVNNYENQTNLLANVQISSVNGINSLQQLQYRTKQTSSSSWSSWVNFSNNTQTPINLDNLFAWDFQIRATDKFDTTTHNIAIPKGMPILFFDTKKLSVGVNCFPTKSSSFEVNGKTIADIIYPIGSIYMSISSVNPTAFFGGTWTVWGSGRVAVGVDTSQTEFNAVEKQGGSKNIQDHNHRQKTNSGGTTGGNSVEFTRRGIITETTGNQNSVYTGGVEGTPVGTSGNLQPYICCYMFKRTA